jgi:hypothetical protein
VADPVVVNGVALLEAVSELHKRGFERLRIRAGLVPSGMHWRCSLYPKGAKGAWHPPYTSADDRAYFGWGDTSGDGPRTIADKIAARFPGLVLASQGADKPYADWMVRTVDRARAGALPVFYCDWDRTPGPDELPPDWPD